MVEAAPLADIPDVSDDGFAFVFNPDGSIHKLGTIRAATERLLDARAIDPTAHRRTLQRQVQGWLDRHGYRLVHEGLTSASIYSMYCSVFRTIPALRTALVIPAAPKVEPAPRLGTRERLGYVLRKMREMEQMRGELQAEADQLREAVRSDEIANFAREVRQWRALGFTLQDVQRVWEADGEG